MRRSPARAERPLGVLDLVRVDRRAANGLEGEGFAALRGFVSGRDLEEFRAGVEAKLREPMAPGCRRPHNTLAPLRFNDELVVRALGSEHRVASIRAASDAHDLRWISAYVSVKEG